MDGFKKLRPEAFKKNFAIPPKPGKRTMERKYPRNLVPKMEQFQPLLPKAKKLLPGKKMQRPPLGESATLREKLMKATGAASTRLERDRLAKKELTFRSPLINKGKMSK